MRIDVITLFPDLFVPFQQQGVVRRAFDSGAVNLKLWQLRDFASGNYRRVDDRPFGGGPGMVMAATELLKHNKKPTVAEIRHHLDGNICRCTGYHNIVKSIMAASGQDVSSIAAE